MIHAALDIMSLILHLIMSCTNRPILERCISLSWQYCDISTHHLPIVIDLLLFWKFYYPITFYAYLKGLYIARQKVWHKWKKFLLLISKKILFVIKVYASFQTRNSPIRIWISNFYLRYQKNPWVQYFYFAKYL